MKLDLSNVTLVSIDDLRDDATEYNIRYNILTKVIEYAYDYIDFYDIKLLTPLTDFGVKFQSSSDYSRWVIEKLPFLIKSKYYLIIQWDGFIINPMSWSTTWFEYDYIGGGVHLQNGGFSLRKTETMQKVSDIRILTQFSNGDINHLPWANEDSYYSCFFKETSENLHKWYSFREGFYEYLIENKLLFKTPFDANNIHSESDSNLFSTFHSYNKNSFGWHWSGELDMNVVIGFYLKTNKFSSLEIDKIYSYLNKRINR